MEHPIVTRIRREGFEPLGWFSPLADDNLPSETRFVLLIGNAGPAMFRRFARECDPAVAQMDEWTRSTVDALAAEFAARAVYPFDRPYHPFLTWARRGGGGHVSPLGLNIHPRYGLWHAYRAALLFPVAFDLPPLAAGDHPCDSCATRPCLNACPVAAFDGTYYDVKTCGRHILADSGQTCMTTGCKARLACPIGAAYRYEPEQMAFHMEAFRRAREKELT